MRVEILARSLIASCQPVAGGPMDNADCVVGFALAALAGGADALRIESLHYVRAVRAETDAPIIGIVKQDRADTEVRITPTVELAVELCEAGSDIVAFDATRRSRPAAVTDLVAAIRSRGKIAMADCSDLEDAREALVAGADLVGTTLSGYTGGPMPEEPDFALISAMRGLSPYVVAEGRIHHPEQAAEALRRGAFCVVVGSALTRTEHATSWFRGAMDAAIAGFDQPGSPTLAIDIGGTKILTGLVLGGSVQIERTMPTDPQGGPDHWLSEVAQLTSDWSGHYSKVAVAVTGLVDDGMWSSLNPQTLAVPERFPLAARAEQRLGAPAFAVNDAQAAAWGEYRFGAGNNEDLVFLTISTGIGGGVVIDGRLRSGLAGHFGLTRGPSSDHESPLEDEASGRWIADQARRAGRDMSAVGVFASAAKGEIWAEKIVALTARRIARLCADIQLVIDPVRIIIGGGIGLAPTFIERIERELAELAPRLRPRVVPAGLKTRAGLVGAADLFMAKSRS